MQTGLFDYFNGETPIHGDPLAIHRRLLIGLGSNANELIAQVGHDAPEVSGPATEQFLAAVRKAFALVPLDPRTGRGARDADVFAVYNEFTDWLDKKKMTTATSPTSSPLTTFSPPDRSPLTSSLA